VMLLSQVRDLIEAAISATDPDGRYSVEDDGLASTWTVAPDFDGRPPPSRPVGSGPIRWRDHLGETSTAPRRGRHRSSGIHESPNHARLSDYVIR